MSNDDEQHELDILRMKKMQALMEAKKQSEAVKEKVGSINEKIDYILKVVLMPDSYTYLNKLKENEPRVYQYIFNEIVSPDVIQNIDYLLSVISSRGGVNRRIPIDPIIMLERKVKGIKSKIQVKRGERQFHNPSHSFCHRIF